MRADTGTTPGALRTPARQGPVWPASQAPLGVHRGAARRGASHAPPERRADGSILALKERSAVASPGVLPLLDRLGTPACPKQGRERDCSDDHADERATWHQRQRQKQCAEPTDAVPTGAAVAQTRPAPNHNSGLEQRTPRRYQRNLQQLG